MSRLPYQRQVCRVAKALACSSAIGWKSLLPDLSLAYANNVTIGGAGVEKLSHQTASGKAGTCNTQTDGIGYSMRRTGT
jgi:hypothetical protein